MENLGGRFFDPLWFFCIGNIRKERNIGKSGKLLSLWRIKIYFMGGLIWSRPQPRQPVGLFSRLQHLHPGLQPRHLPLAVQLLWRGHLLFCTTGDCAESTDPACPGLLRLIQTHSCRPHQSDFASREAEADPKLALSIFFLFEHNYPGRSPWRWAHFSTLRGPLLKKHSHICPGQKQKEMNITALTQTQMHFYHHSIFWVYQNGYEKL